MKGEFICPKNKIFLLSICLLFLIVGIGGQIVLGKESNAVSSGESDLEFAVAKVLREMPDSP